MLFVDVCVCGLRFGVCCALIVVVCCMLSLFVYCLLFDGCVCWLLFVVLLFAGWFLLVARCSVFVVYCASCVVGRRVVLAV